MYTIGFSKCDTTAFAYSAIIICTDSLLLLYLGYIACSGHEPTHRTQPVHFSVILATSEITMASAWHTNLHLLHALHFFIFTFGLLSECITSLPALEAQPIERFFIAPPNPVNSWPLKCETTKSASAFRIPVAIWAVFNNLPSGTGISRISSPLNPSAIITGVCSVE
jgi:hypothetical protein